jgi:hypothetical protein
VISRIGFIGSIDCEYSFHDKILNHGIGRKWTIGLSFRNKEKTFLSYIGWGLKGFKINAYSPSFRESFINDIQQNYEPINGLSEDSLIGAKMNSGPGNSLWGTYAYYIQAGFIIDRKLRPSFNFYFGSEEYLLHDDKFTKFEDPTNGDINYVGMNTLSYEFKLGLAVPFSFFSEKPYCLNLNLGYKYVDYGKISFYKTPLSAYTKGNLANKYNKTGKITLSISYMFWSNWE